MRKLFTALLGFTLVLSVVSPVMAADPSVESNPEAHTISATDAGKLSAHWARFYDLWVDLVEHEQWPDAASDWRNDILELLKGATGFQSQLEGLIIDYFRYKIQNSFRLEVDRYSAAGYILNLRSVPDAAHRQRTYDTLAAPWPKSRYDEWVSFYNSYRSSHYAMAPRVTKYADHARLSQDHKNLAQFGAEVGHLLGLHAKLKEEIPSRMVGDFTAVSTRLYEDVKVIFDEVVGASSGQSQAALDALLKGEPRHTIYSTLGSPWPRSRWIVWDQFYKAFTKVTR